MKIKWVNEPYAFSSAEWEIDLEEGDISPILYEKIPEMRSNGFIVRGILPYSYRIGRNKILCVVDSSEIIKPCFDNMSLDPASDRSE